MSRLGAIAVIAFVAFAARTGRADSITTSDGSTLRGKILKITDEKLTIQTEIAGKLEIDASLVISVSTDAPVNVEFETGDTLVGRLETAPDTSQTLVHSAVGDISVDTSKIVTLWGKDAEHPRMEALREETARKIEEAQPDWSFTLEFGAERTEGNTDTLDVRGRMDLKRTTPKDMLLFYAAGAYREDTNVRTENEYYGGIRYEYLLTDRWYLYSNLELEHDEFENLDLRATFTAGAGYYWIKRPDHELKTSLGAGYRHETYEDGRTEDDPILDMGLEYRVDLANWVRFTHSTFYRPSLEEFSDYRLNLDTALVFPFKDPRWKWKVGMRNEYNSRPDPGLERLDNTYYTSIVVDLVPK